MKITKYVHSCLLVEDGNEVVLVDPGVMSWGSGLVDLKKWPKIDEIAITHEHGDHFHMPFVKAVLERWGRVRIVTNPSVKALLAKEGITSRVETGNTDLIVQTPLAHAKLGWGPAPANNMLRIMRDLTHPGDSHNAPESSRILALPITAPWGSTTRALEMAFQLKPEVVIPIHDWMWLDEARADMYARVEKFFADQGIKFIKAVDGKVFEV
jgi:L-ascorbate metabolism protein UlaG (beta-lactamase superfamily)